MKHKKLYLYFNYAIWPIYGKTLEQAKRMADKWATEQDHATTGLCIFDENDHHLAGRHAHYQDDTYAMKHGWMRNDVEIEFKDGSSLGKWS